jgi:signal transduction histidine kinase
MSTTTQKHSKSFLSACLPAGIIGLSLLILGATILAASKDLRQKIREQIAGQDARILYALWLSQQSSEEADTELELSDNPADWLTTVLQTAQLPQLTGLLGTRFFDAQGRFETGDPNVSETNLDAEDVIRLGRLEPIARFRPAADLDEVQPWLAGEESSTGPLLEICIPLHTSRQQQLLGIAQFILDGRSIEAEFRKLDRNLAFQGSIAFAAGGGLLVIVLGLGFRQLQKINRLLTERTHSLLRANQELAMAAKTSAVGAVTAHLIHGLKNPLSGLQAFVHSRGASPENGAEGEWQLAISSARRMQTMISETVRVLRDEQGANLYEISLEEFAELLETKVKPLATESGVKFHCTLSAAAVLTNREANLISLIIYNLIQNAIQATPAGKTVEVSFCQRDGKIVCEVRDEGNGFPELQQRLLFQPCQSTKGGCGVGLTISKQLANSLGAELELKETGPNGSTFVLAFPTPTRSEKTSLASRRDPS